MHAFLSLQLHHSWLVHCANLSFIDTRANLINECPSMRTLRVQYDNNNSAVSVLVAFWRSKRGEEGLTVMGFHQFEQLPRMQAGYGPLIRYLLVVGADMTT